MILVEVYDSEDDDAQFICLMTFENSYKFDAFFGNCSFEDDMYFQIIGLGSRVETCFKQLVCTRKDLNSLIM